MAGLTQQKHGFIQANASANLEALVYTNVERQSGAAAVILHPYALLVSTAAAAAATRRHPPPSRSHPLRPCRRLTHTGRVDARPHRHRALPCGLRQPCVHPCREIQSAGRGAIVGPEECAGQGGLRRRAGRCRVGRGAAAARPRPARGGHRVGALGGRASARCSPPPTPAALLYVLSPSAMLALLPCCCCCCCHAPF